MLDICIPSFNRIDKVVRTLNSIIDSDVNEELTFYIIDNHSEDDYELQLKNIFKKNYNKNLFIIRNFTNIGMSANIMKCFDQGKNKYLMLLADDDKVLPNFYQQIYELLVNLDNNISAIKLSSSSNKVINNIDNFIKITKDSDNFNSFIFLSNLIYKRSAIKEHIHAGYKSCDSYIPHFMVLTSMLQSGLNLKLSKTKVIEYVIPEVGYDYAFVAGLGVGSFKNILLGLNKKKTLEFHSMFYPHNDFKVLIDLRAQTLSRGSINDYQYFSKNYIYQIHRFRKKSLLFLLRIFSIFLRSKTFFSYFVLKNKFLPSYVQDHINEIKYRYNIYDE